MEQHVRFCTAMDGVRLAYAVHGSGPPLVRVATWLSHLELDWESPVWRHWLKQLGERHTLVRYDERGCGLSDTNVGDPSVDVICVHRASPQPVTCVDALARTLTDDGVRRRMRLKLRLEAVGALPVLKSDLVTGVDLDRIRQLDSSGTAWRTDGSHSGARLQP